MKLNSEKGKAHVLDLKGRIRNVLSSRLDELSGHNPLRIACNNCILTGGAIVSMFHNEVPNDFDLLFNFTADLEQVKFDIANGTERIIHRSLVKNVNTKYFREKTPPLKDGKLITDWAVTLYNDVQLVLRHCSYRTGFDFVHVMPYYDISRDKLFISQAQFDCLIKKEIKINPDHCQPICEKRVLKYTDRGWTISDEEINKYSDKKNIIIEPVEDNDPPF